MDHELFINPSPEPDPRTPGPASGAFAQLARMLHNSNETSLHPVLQQVAELAQELIPELETVSVTLLGQGKPHTVVFTSPLAAFLDERQYERGFGPCTDAALSGGTVAVDTTDPGSAYPEFARVAAGQGIRHSLSVGLPIPQRTIGALNMYSAADHPVSADSVVLAEAFAGYAAVALANATLYHSAVDEAHHMHAALRHRSTIEQAKGILMATRHCSPEEAFGLLTRASQHQNRKLHEVAAELVARTIA